MSIGIKYYFTMAQERFGNWEMAPVFDLISDARMRGEDRTLCYRVIEECDQRMERGSQCL